MSDLRNQLLQAAKNGQGDANSMVRESVSRHKNLMTGKHSFKARIALAVNSENSGYRPLKLQANSDEEAIGKAKGAISNVELVTRVYQVDCEPEKLIYDHKGFLIS